MELDELKNIWQKNPSGFVPKGEDELARMLKGSSRSIVDKLKRSVWFELLFTVVSGIVLLLYAFSLPNGALKWTSVSILILFVAYPVYYIKKLVLLHRFNPGDDHLKANLEKLIDNLSSYLNFYIRSYTLLYPVYFVLALIFLAMERGSEQFFDSLSNPKTVAYLIVLAGIFYAASKLFTTWYLKKLYGNHLEKLKTVLSELVSFDKPEELHLS
ncbi:MAG TPA: hypothetical protein VEB86_06745 [Chryseosolibacter sp.]|nr:hypothetical protein [Chryseosolibacter sp.]